MQHIGPIAAEVVAKAGIKAGLRRECTIAGCERVVLAHGWCSKHYQRWRRHGDPLAGSTDMGATLEWLRAHVHHTGSDCLLWPFARTRGYAETWWNGKPAIASRVMCTLAHGEPPTPDHEAAHSCGQGKSGCVHPEHLRWATRVENQADRLLHDTHNRGSRHGMSKLTEDQVRQIKAHLGTRSQADIARDFGVVQQTISDIATGRRWAWLDGEHNDVR